MLGWSQCLGFGLEPYLKCVTLLPKDSVCANTKEEQEDSLQVNIIPERKKSGFVSSYSWRLKSALARLAGCGS